MNLAGGLGIDGTLVLKNYVLSEINNYLNLSGPTGLALTNLSFDLYSFGTPGELSTSKISLYYNTGIYYLNSLYSGSGLNYPLNIYN